LDQGIGAFEMEKEGKNIRYKYRCNEVNVDKRGSVTTDFMRAGHGEVQGLANHDVAGPKYTDNLQALRGWSMKVKYTSKWCTIFCDSYQDIRFEIFYADLKN